MTNSPTTELPLLVTLEGAELFLEGPENEPHMRVTVMTFSEDADCIVFIMGLMDYIEFLEANTLNGIPNNPNYPRFELITKDGKPILKIADTWDMGAVALKRTERAA